MLKLVKLDEYAIHSFLSSIKATHNHTIPILLRVVVDKGMIIAMPEGSALGNVHNSVFKTRGSDLAYQFLEGVRFMHQHNVAHLDLKPNNIIVMATTNSVWLCIIDFGVSVWVPEQESFIEG